MPRAAQGNQGFVGGVGVEVGADVYADGDLVVGGALVAVQRNQLGQEFQRQIVYAKEAVVFQQIEGDGFA